MDTNKMRDISREQFEQWWANQLWAECYADVKEQMFASWKASREAVAVELPNADGLNREHMLVQGFLEGIAHTRAAIEATGLRVAP